MSRIHRPRAKRFALHGFLIALALLTTRVHADECSDFRAALYAYETSYDSAAHDALLDASEAVNRAVTDEYAASPTSATHPRF